jgi:hypothetical protein
MKTMALARAIGDGPVVQREWAVKSYATFKVPISDEEVLNSRMIASPL